MPAHFLGVQTSFEDDVSGIRTVDADAMGAASLADGEALLARGDLEAAAERLQAAANAFEARRDAAGAARALLGLGHVLLGLDNPACREVLEDAGTYLEDIGDEEGVLRVDRLLRVADAAFVKESPRSFHSSHLMKAAAKIV